PISPRKRRERTPGTGHASAASEPLRRPCPSPRSATRATIFGRRNRTRHNQSFHRRHSRCIHGADGGKPTMFTSLTKKTVCACIVLCAGAAAVIAQSDPLTEAVGRFRAALESGDYATADRELAGALEVSESSGNPASAQLAHALATIRLDL